MNKIMKMGALAVLTSAVMSSAAWAKNTDTVVVDTLDRTQEVSYVCQNGKLSQKISVMYGMKNGEVVVAQTKVNGITSMGLWRLPHGSMNVYESREGNPTMWVTAPATANNLREVGDGVLSVQRNGQQQILLEKCKVDRAAR